jgi:hypothetical protein
MPVRLLENGFFFSLALVSRQICNNVSTELEPLETERRQRCQRSRQDLAGRTPWVTSDARHVDPRRAHGHARSGDLASLSTTCALFF